jgi:hypothetical protein
MTTATKKTAALLGAAVALSSGAYALGSQAGDGGALASGAGAQGGSPGDPLAERLGVTPAALRAALTDLRADKTPRASAWPSSTSR